MTKQQRKRQLKVFRETGVTQPEVHEIINYVKQQFTDKGICHVEDVCELEQWKEKGLKPWHVVSLFTNAGVAQFWKDKYYGNGMQISWNPKRVTQLWDLWTSGNDDWDIAKIIGTSVGTIRKRRSQLHKETGNKGWVKFQRVHRGKIVAHEKVLKHSTAVFTGREKSETEQSALPFPLIINDPKAPVSPEQIRDFEEALKQASKAGLVPMLPNAEVTIREKTLELCIIESLFPMFTSQATTFLKKAELELCFTPWKELCKMQQNKEYHYKMVVDETELYFKLLNLDVDNRLAKFYCQYSRKSAK